MNSFYSCFETHTFRYAIDDIRRLTKAYGDLLVEEEDVFRVFVYTCEETSRS